MSRFPEDLICRAASFFRIVGDETRMKILCSISSGELCVNDIAASVGMTKSSVSHQLKLLKDEGLVKNRREGKNIFYSLDDQHVVDIIDIAFIHIEHKAHADGCCCDACSQAHCQD
ncbi:MAG: helix-turn-helix transcriptional regulator [Firmicutes bacterium]|nr:helix-turn-helix transcriptional regulator [Bacillota bacterium]